MYFALRIFLGSKWKGSGGVLPVLLTLFPTHDAGARKKALQNEKRGLGEDPFPPKPLFERPGPFFKGVSQSCPRPFLSNDEG
jgi:hypothetical protein